VIKKRGLSENKLKLNGTNQMKAKRDSHWVQHLFQANLSRQRRISEPPSN
jgi:hypothetical protein